MSFVKRLRIYTDTSVFGGVFDEEFSEDSKRFFEDVKEGRFRILISDVTVAEIQKAPLNILQFFLSFPEEHMEHVVLAREAIELRDRYIQAGALPPACLNDAAHVALYKSIEIRSPKEVLLED